MGVPPEPPPPPEEPPPPPPVGAEGGDCPRCGTPYEPYQEYCLECGLRLPVTAGLIPVLATAWRRRVPWYPGDWVWPVLGALIIASLGAALAILANQDNGSSATKTRAETGTSVPAGHRNRPHVAAAIGHRHVDAADRTGADDRRATASSASTVEPARRVAAGPERLDDRPLLGPAERRASSRRE